MNPHIYTLQGRVYTKRGTKVLSAVSVLRKGGGQPEDKNSGKSLRSDCPKEREKCMFPYIYTLQGRVY